MRELLAAAAYMLALINPISKVFILSMLAQKTEQRDLRRASIQASGVALLLLLLLAAGGKWILGEIFHVEIYSLRIAGGVILFVIGYKALSRGIFFEVKETGSLTDVSMVPLASPMIAGPATITAAISFQPQFGLPKTALAILIAVAANLLVMLCAPFITRLLTRHNLMGALIRITGLVVATIAVQMVLAGLSEWYALQ